MLRITGILALVASAVLAVLLFGRVRTVRVAGQLRAGGSMAPVVLDLSGKDLPQFGDEETPALVAGYGWGTSGAIYLFLLETDEIARDLPEDGAVPAKMTHRWVTFKGLRKPYGCVDLSMGGRTYAAGRSSTAFFGMLTLISAGPSLLWLLAALPTLLQGRAKPPASVA